MRLDVSDVDVIQKKTVPHGTKLAGWSLLVQALDIAGPVRHPSMAADLVAYILGNHGTLSPRRRRGEFAQLRDDEVARIETIVRNSFERASE